MPRSLLTLIALLLLVFVGGAVTLYLAYGVDGDVPGTLSVGTLSAPVEIGWHDEGFVTIDAQEEADAYGALGFVHGVRSAWQILLWRQASLGRLHEWYGADVVAIDALSRKLGLAEGARRAYDRLPAAPKSLLDGYAAGVNAALLRSGARLEDDLVLFDIEPEAWAPWHTLAVERLFAWLATTPPPADSLSLMSEDLRSFYRGDQALRSLLHLHGFENSLAWAVQDGGGTVFFQRQVYGASALPFFQEVQIRLPAATFLAATVPGTFLLPAGKSSSRAWTILLSSDVTFERVPADTLLAPQRYERLTLAGGNERLIDFRRSDELLYFEPPDRWPVVSLGVDAAAPPLDSTWVIRWPGLRAASDFDAWRAVPHGEASGFRLFAHKGITVTPSGAVQVLGSPRIVQRFPAGVLVGGTPWAAHVAVRLDTLTRRNSFDPNRLQADAFSPWAAELAPRLVEQVASLPTADPLVSEALTYLRNWDFAYDRASIGASIFDSWMATYRDSVGHLPTAQVADTLFHEPLVRYRLLVRTVDALAATFGNNLSQWRWENVQPRRYLFPAWDGVLQDVAPDSGASVLAETRYAPIEMPGSGHPSALLWGPSIIEEKLTAPAYWDAFLSTSSWETYELHRYRFEPEAFFGRYLIMRRPPTPLTLPAAAPPRGTTTLLPR